MDSLCIYTKQNRRKTSKDVLRTFIGLVVYENIGFYLFSAF